MKKFLALIFAALLFSTISYAAPRKHQVADGEYRNTTLSNGKTIACFAIQAGKSAMPGRIKRSRNKIFFIPSQKSDKRKIKNIQAQLARASGATAKKLQRKLKKQRSLVKEKKQACALGLDSPEQDPDNVFAELESTPSEAQIRLLLERAGFGSSYREWYVLATAQNDGIAAAVDALMARKNEPAWLLPEVEDWLDGRQENTDERRMEFYGMRNAWTTVLVHTHNPFREKLALFLWSIWGASENSFGYNERDYLWEYISAVREHAYRGSLIDMTRELSVHPSMLRWLDNGTNVKGKIQEQFAAAFLHSFLLGSENYEQGLFSNSDVQGVAQAFSGWQLVALEDAEGEDVLRPFFISSDHVSGAKGLFAGTPYSCSVDTEEDVYRCLFTKHDGVAQYYAKKLLQFYLTEEPSTDLTKAFAGVIKEKNFKLDEALAVLFKSALFYRPEFKNTAVKSPIEVGVEWIRTLDIPVRIGDGYSGVRAQFDRMGMSLTSPQSPGWFSQKKHLSQNYFLSLSNFYAAVYRQTSLFEELEWTPQKILPEGEVYSREIILHVARVLDVTLTEDQISQLKYYMDYEVNYLGEHERELYDNLLSSHQRRKGLGLYMLLGMTPDFILK